MRLGKRIKRYELASNRYLTAKVPVVIRVAGKAFHTYTKSFNKPFDSTLITAMYYAGYHTAKSMMGFKLGYHQSDEFTFLLTDFDRPESETWFDYKLQKLVSISASMFTARFNNYIRYFVPDLEKLAFFDSRAFNVPYEDVPNIFVWRQRDWERNSLQMYCRSFFSHKQLLNKNKEQMHEMLHSIGQNWSNLDDHLKNGTFIDKNLNMFSDKLNYQEIRDLIEE